MRRGGAILRAAALLGAVGLAVAAAQEPTVAPEPAPVPPIQPSVARTEAATRFVLPLGGRLVALHALPGATSAWALVRPDDEVDGPRRLLRLDWSGAPAVDLVAGDLGGWTKSLTAIDLGSGPELLVGGLARLDSLGPLGAPRAAGRTLIEHAGFDLRSLDPRRLRVGVAREIAAAEVGALRVWAPDGGGGLAIAAERDLPFDVERIETGLRLTGTRVTELPATGEGAARFAVGPEAMSGKRFRISVLLESGGAWTEQENWVVAPAPEKVEESWVLDFDDSPALVARTQGGAELNVFEAQRWRLWRLGADRTRAGRPASLAVEVDSKRWHDNSATVADVDGDGRDDLIVARPEGMSGSDLVVQVYRGAANGRFENRTRRNDLDNAGEGWRLFGPQETGGAPLVATRARGRLTLYAFARQGRKPLERAPLLELALPGGPEATNGFEWLGALPGTRTPGLLLVAEGEKEDSLLVVSPR